MIHFKKQIMLGFGNNRVNVVKGSFHEKKVKNFFSETPITSSFSKT